MEQQLMMRAAIFSIAAGLHFACGSSCPVSSTKTPEPAVPTGPSTSATVSSDAAHSPSVPPTYDTLIWSDEFDQPQLDPAKWQHETGTGVDFYPFMDGWGNDELQYFSPDNTSIENGMLVITAKYTETPIEGKHYTSSKIVTKTKFDFKYGRIEARIKLPQGDPGIWPAFWMMGANVGKAPERVPWAQCGEIDIMEMGGKTPERVGCSMHFGGWPKNTYRTKSTRITPGEFHIYRLDWSESEIRGYVDNRLYHTFPIDTDLKREAFRHPFYLLLNLSIGGKYAHSGDPVPENYQNGISLLVDWVRVYQ